MTNQYDGLIEDLLAAHSQKKMCTTAALTIRKMAAALSRLTRDVEEAKEALEKIVEATRYVENSYARAAYNLARATLTRLSRPTDLEDK